MCNGSSGRARSWPLSLGSVFEKRFGIGFTLNFGHLGAWVFLAVLVAFTVTIFLIAPRHHHP